ncbi:glucohydrolase [Bacillus sp. FJAT-27225]|uniref:alpha-glucosidase n=1 Tax=Bacillus sp. FJAT-27225 TaxID=1743144 RepID=UPI00080C2D6C|nr:alpha-glucosidase [Bacillus sp. FJAT-27225]OCA88333.1 glucohydrolase [Bacillus sp. FJAT-27225]
MEKWWQKSVFYEIYMPSFKDGNGDGIGDFRGITSKLDYLADLGINGLWLTPFYPSPRVDNGYDISDYYGIDPIYGTMEDFERFLAEAHKRGIKVIADLVLNHTSSEHQWFKESRSSKDNPKRDWYIWRDEPNNWESFFSGSAWEYDEATKQYYYHAFAKEQVDLNWANPEVKQAMFNVMKFWLEKGVDGFRLDVINYLKVNNTFPDNPYDEKNEQIHLYDQDQEGILDVISEIAELVHQYPDKFLVGEVGSEDIHVLKQYSGSGKLDVCFNFNIGSIETFDIEQLFGQLSATEEAYGPDQTATLFFSSHDMSRHFSRFGGNPERAKQMAALMLTAKGVPFIYQGDEIGMPDWVPADIADMRDVQGKLEYKKAIRSGASHEEALAQANERCRDKSRTPMQWDSSEYAGFSESEPWITVPAESSDVTVESQHGVPGSVLSFYKKLLQLRKEHLSFQTGDYEILRKQGEVIYFVRTNGKERTLTALNFSGEMQTLEVETKGMALLLSNKRTELEQGKQLELLPDEAIILVEDTKKCLF